MIYVGKQAGFHTRTQAFFPSSLAVIACVNNRQYLFHASLSMFGSGLCLREVQRRNSVVDLDLRVSCLRLSNSASSYKSCMEPQGKRGIQSRINCAAVVGH